MGERSFFEVFRVLGDPRHERGKKYPLMDVIILAVYGVLIGFEDFTNMSYYLKKREAELKERLGLEEGVPSHDVFSDVFRLIDVAHFMRLFVEWTRQAACAKTGRHIAIDGKAVRAATKKAQNGAVPYVVSAFMCGCGLSAGQKEVGEKTDEITEIPLLLDLIDINDCFVTIDAIGTQTEIMDRMVGKGGHFCLQLKRNQRTAFDDVALFFGGMERDCPKDFAALPSFKETQKGHGRIETREYRLCTDPGAVRAVLGPKWGHVACLGMARLRRDVGGTVSEETHFHLLDKAISAEEYAGLARGHWAIENSLHWVLDIHFREDSSTANADRAISNLTLLRRIAFNFTKLDPAMQKKTTRKKMIDYMTDLSIFEKLIYEVIPTNA